MGIQKTPLGQHEKERLAHFLHRRQLKDKILELLANIKAQHGLKRGEVTTAKSATYDVLVDSLVNCISSDWLDLDQLIKILEEAEIAGRQHICVFEVAKENLDQIKESLLQPKTLNQDPVQFRDFWNIPLEPYTRIVNNDSSVLISKTLSIRTYWVEREVDVREDYIKLIRRRERERTALITKLDLSSRLLQFRVPVKEKAPGIDTTKSVYAFIAEMVEAQYGEAGVEWLKLLKTYRINNAFQNIVDNRTDFRMHTDHPENQHFKSSMSSKGSPDRSTDIRDFGEWVFANGFARSCIRGSWQMQSNAIDVRMHYEPIRIGAMTRSISRLYFAKPYSDSEIEYVIQRIQAHF